MKKIILSAILITFFGFAKAENAPNPGPTISAGMPALSSLLSVSIQKPIPGTDYPQDFPPGYKLPQSVLVIDGQSLPSPVPNNSYNKRIPIYDVTPAVVQPEPGIDYPTDAPTPIFNILIFPNGIRTPLFFAFFDDGYNSKLLWKLGEQGNIDVQNINYIEKANAEDGDFPTDVYRDYYVVVLRDNANTRIPLLK